MIGDRGRVIGVDEWATLWVVNNAAYGPDTTRIGPDVTVRTWRGTSSQCDVEFRCVEGGGHTWPGGRGYLPERYIGATSGSFDATGDIWRFLSRHHLG